MKNILVPVGSREGGLNNLRYAVNFARFSGATVYLINIYHEYSHVATMTKVNKLMKEDSESLLNEIMSQVDPQGVKIIAKPIQGDPFEAITRIAKQLHIDLLILSPQSIDIRNELYLGKITGKIVKQSDIPVLIVPRDYRFRKAETILLAFKRGHIENENVLAPLKEIAKLFNAKINLLQVITADIIDENTSIDTELSDLSSSLTVTENATVFQGVLEHFQSQQPDMLCVIRRKRGFFKKLWEKNSVLKKDFYTSKPLLVLRGQE